MVKSFYIYGFVDWVWLINTIEKVKCSKELLPYSIWNCQGKKTTATRITWLKIQYLLIQENWAKRESNRFNTGLAVTVSNLVLYQLLSLQVLFSWKISRRSKVLVWFTEIAQIKVQIATKAINFNWNFKVWFGPWWRMLCAVLWEVRGTSSA